MVALADLGSLGSREGPAAHYRWVMPNFAPQLLPWLVILGLLALKSNRTPAAWLIWLPLGCVLAFTSIPSLFPSGADFFIDVVAALAIGYTAIWLLADRLRRQNGFLTFLCVLGALAGASLLAVMLRQSGSLVTYEVMPIVMILAMGVWVTSVALSLDGLIWRHRYRPAGLYLWLLVLIVAIWLLVSAPIFLAIVILQGAKPGWSEFFIPVLGVALCHFATLLPFLILSSACPFYRERIKALLHIWPEVPPPLAVRPPDASSNI